MVMINGEEREAAGMLLSDYLQENGYSVVRIAVERNDEMVPKTEYAETTLMDGDVVEIVSFVGGG
ncbi:MAG: sulfur carrier protein ThiS [Lachnospiraceae bacterium]|nr:sulfur carrier protein ThiS [Lachnospiraceae bacterium]